MDWYFRRMTYDNPQHAQNFHLSAYLPSIWELLMILHMLLIWSNSQAS